MQPRRITWIVLAIFALLLAAGCYLVLRPFLSEICLALVLAIVLFPAYDWVRTKTARPTLSAWIVTLLTGLLFLLPVTMLGIVVAQQANSALDALNRSIGPSGSFEWLDKGIVFVSDKIGWEPGQTKEFLQTKLSNISSTLISNVLRSLQSLGSWIFSIIVTLVTMYFLFTSGERVVESSKQWLPLPPRMVDQLYSETRNLMFANVYGVLAVAIAQGALTTIGFWLTSLPSGLFWGTLAALFSVVPVVGAGIIWLPGAIFLLVSGSVTKGLILLGWGTLVISMADNVIRPIVLSDKAEMHTAVMFFALLGGIEAFGLIGLFLGPIVFSLAGAVLKLLREQSKLIHLESEQSTNP